MKNLILTLIITLPLTLWGQGWEKTYNLSEYDIGYSVQQTNEGGYILTGFISIMEQDFVLVKLNSLGDTLWTNSIIESHDQEGRSVKQTNDGGYVICGTREDDQGNGNIWLVKTDSIGNMTWNVTFGDTSNYSKGFSVEQTLDGGYIITGSIDQGNSDDVILIKTNGNGNEQWNQTFGGIEEDDGYSVQQTSDGGYIITGRTRSFGNGLEDVWLIKTDENGIEQWNQTFGGVDHDFGDWVQQTTDGGYIITGSTFSFGNGGRDLYLIKTDENGIEQWNQTFGGTDTDVGRCVQQTSDGGFIITGGTESFGNGGSDVYLIKTNENGQEQWDQTFGGLYDDGGSSIQQTQDGGYIICGGSFTDNTNEDYSDLYLIKTDDQGNITSTFEIPLHNPDRKLEKTVNLIGQEIKPQKNTPIIEIFDDGSTQKKIIIE